MLCLEHCFIWLRDLDTKKIGTQVLGELRGECWRRMEKIKWSKKVTNEQILEHKPIREEDTSK